ncbi:MAG TPA: hypothetical protein VFO10_05210 [Oligoflexus sp.]|uniref:hypothetical protein n=1 Tax=Oligoflexus sp. TaxID=1971216 RepID=UPI002D7F04B7|nr:hypothetical protein [Oligoflexus sp.]HET9236623.1 hypothetical protein [Oligoflexus sp.]
MTAAYNPLPGKSFTVDYTNDSPAPGRLRFLSDLVAYDYDDNANRTMELRQGKSVPVKLEVSLTDKRSVFTDATSQATIEYSKSDVVAIKDRVLTALKPGKVDLVARYKDAEGVRSAGRSLWTCR